MIAVLLALVFLALHLPYLPSSLEDLDSINFALGVRRFDVAQHQPHPPGYPVFIAAGKIAHLLVRDEAKALALISVVGAALGVVAIGWLFRRLDRDRLPTWWTLVATAVAMTSPLYWFTAARPLSDAAGLAAALAVQALIVGAAGERTLAIAGFCAGVASGIRSQVFWLTVPLLIVTGFVNRNSGFARDVRGPRSVAVALGAFAAGALVWFVPLVVVTGGPAAYWHALSNQGAEDLGNITMLWTTHNARVVADAFYYALVAPWATWTIAIGVLAFAVLGAARLWRANRRALALLAAAFGPYFVFDLLFQEAFTSRYALPLVVPMAFLAAEGMRPLPRGAGVAVAVAIAMFDAHVGGTSIAAYARQKAPAFRLLDDMRDAARPGSSAPVLAMDRRNAFDFRRPIVWERDTLPRFEQTLPGPPQHEWLEPVKYWTRGGRAPVWFVVDPKRTAIDLVQHGEPARYRWPLPYPVLVSGARPDEMDWYRVDRPEWYVGEGWSLTPEAAGVAAADHRGLAYGPIHAGIGRSATSPEGAIVIGGRSFDPAARPRVTAILDGEAVLDETLTPGAFLKFVRPVRTGAHDGDYSALTIATTPPASVAIEQFDASAGRPLLGFGAGWHEQEFNPATGVRWRWLSERGELKLIPRGAPLTLHLEGENPRRYFDRGSRLVIRSRDRVIFDRVLAEDFSVDVALGRFVDATRNPEPEVVTLETDQTYMPADRSRRTQDRRRLGLRIFRCEVR